jgi:hypothetical protein
MRLLVAGSLRNVPRDPELCEQFATVLGRELAKQGHVLLHGCSGSLDQELATAANGWLVENGRDPKKQIVGYCNRGSVPKFTCGTIYESLLSDWYMNHPELNVPEQVSKADATIFIAGSEGTFWAKNWAFYARKPILGIPRFGGAGQTIFDLELRRLAADSPAVVEDYEALNQVSPDIARYVADVLALAERMVAPRSVFAVMSFDKGYDDVFDSYKEVCKEFDFEAERTNESASLERIVPRVEKGIKECAFVLADVSETSPNVFYELGFARGLGKTVVLTARKGTELPFDVGDIPVIFWESQRGLRESLGKRLLEIKGKHRT